MSLPPPAIVAQSPVRRIPRSILLVLCGVYILAGFVGRAPWREVDMQAFALMRALAQGEPAARVYGLAHGAMLPSHDQRSEEHEVSGRMNLLKRLTDPEELADVALFMARGWLASGETIFVDSGQHLLSQPRDVLYLARQ